MTKFRLGWLAVLAAGCSSGPPAMPPSKAIEPKGPSDQTVTAISLDPAVTRTTSRTGEPAVWVPKGFQPSGEEKLEFERLKVTPTSTGAPAGDQPGIHIGGHVQDAEIFDRMVKTLQASANRKQFPIGEYGLGPFGLTNDLYFGHTFWDLDVWMVPTFVFLAPDAARAAAKYRLDRILPAEQNYYAWLKTKGKSGEVVGMMFPWESSVSGKEVCIQKTKNQHHISGDVLWGLTLSEAMGLVPGIQVKKVADGVGKFYRTRSAVTKRGREILDVTSPNEKFEGDNDLYTNLLAEWSTSDRRWKAKPDFYLPRDGKSLLNYDNDPLRDYQQAAGLLAIYPLQYPEAELQARVMLERFGDKISPSGPAMGHAIVATIWARLGEPDKAYQAWLESWQPYTTGPEHYFSERRNASRPYFLTGAAGAINTVIYGFAGFRIDRVPLPNAKWTKRLKSGWWLSIKPCVPKEIETVSLTGIRIDDEKFDFSMSAAGDFFAKPYR